ncbi:MAG: SRPBCC family protein [Myxococcales bacterium]|nr:SRPBCC family protein [Myxococcales bacterium]
MAASESVQVHYETRIGAPLDSVFPLACPVEEYKWIPGWKCDLVHCPNERVEQGTVFDEYSSAPFLAGKAWAKTTWTAVLHDPDRHRVHYAIKNVASDNLYRIEFSDDGSGGTLAQLDFRYSASGPLGRKVIRKRGEAKIELMLQVLAAMLRHYCESGELVPRDRIARLIATSDAVTVTDRVRFLLNTVAMLRKRDPLRQRYLTELAAGLR